MPPPTQRRELSDSERDQAVVSLLECSVDGKAKAEEARSGQLRPDYSGNARGPPMPDLSEKLEKLRITPFDQRSTLRAVSSACGVARATLQRRVKGGQVVAHEGRVNKGTYRKMLIQHLLPAVRERWPSVCNGEVVRVQQDNTPAYISPMDTQIVAAAAELGLSIELCCQPPNSLDLNCLDLDLFSAIQAHQRLRTPLSIEELVEAVKAAYWELPPSTINAAFLSLQGSMDLCILDGGGNAFKPPHIGKAKLQRES
ncbi:hypothetical protein JG687_00018398 [Phytophthora cactorum]|uniref:Tc1-like transposase DDE domain-containing protein n=1 Tax=Phytophthora cactorum TaxID=29920 RepID=A0A8T1TP04_9STRA|nr:hypothetical protein JG687_00018398 [Phytophthora cactorum]